MTLLGLDFSDLLPFLVIAIVGLLIGLGFGLVVSGGRGDRTPSQQPTAQALPRKTKNYTEVLRVWQRDRDGRIIPELDGEILPHPANMTPEQKQRFQTVSGSLQRWSVPRSADAAVDTPPAQQAKAAAQTAVTAKPFMLEPPVSSAEKTQVSARPFFETAPVASPSQPPLTPYRGVRGQEPPKPAETQGASIVEQIDLIVQEKVRGTELEARGVRLLEIQNQGMIILDGERQFNSVHDIDDNRLKSVIASAVSEWSRRQRSAPAEPTQPG